jgi:hypothetical protein
MQWAQFDENYVNYVIENSTVANMARIVSAASSLIDTARYLPKKIKKNYVNLFKHLVCDVKFKQKFYDKLCPNDIDKKLYERLVWRDKSISENEAKKYNLNADDTFRVDYEFYSFSNNHSLIYYKNDTYWGATKKVLIHPQINLILKFLLPVPDDFEIVEIKEPKPTKYEYDNEAGVLNFISIIDQMLQTNLIQFGKNNEKPLAKTLSTLKPSTTSKEFFTQKGLDLLATDMLTRSFCFYKWDTKSKFNAKPWDTLSDFIINQFNDNLPYSISRIFASHLKKVTFGNGYYHHQKEMFELIKIILDHLPETGWCSVENIINFCKYSDFRFDFESGWKTDQYYMVINSEYKWNNKLHCNSNNYYALFFEPIVKAVFFYLGALGVVQLKYDDPVSPYQEIKAKDKPYISIWDGLKYIKVTNLGNYVLGFTNSYEAKVEMPDKTNIIFDQFKPIITLNEKDKISLAKIEPYVDTFSTNKYILSHTKIFQNCVNYKALELKIDNFYKTIDPSPPKVFKDYFNSIKQKANLLKKDSKQVVIKLENNQELLNFFITNKKLSSLIIKASGYRIIVNKDDIAKVTKILKENGFFVEF